MYRDHLLHMLARYVGVHPGEAGTVERITDFVQLHKDCFLRSCRPGHITASAWVVSAVGDQVLLAKHRRLGRWLQVGGHADGEPEMHRVALREAQEETGIFGLQLVQPTDELTPLDVDIHQIPAHGRDPAHLHYDVRFLLRAPPHTQPRVSAESFDVRWFTPGELTDVTSEESILRLARKAQALAAAY